MTSPSDREVNESYWGYLSINLSIVNINLLMAIGALLSNRVLA